MKAWEMIAAISAAIAGISTTAYNIYRIVIAEKKRAAKRRHRTRRKR
ncbi:MAG: hypothetical protein LBQ80_04100 [Clostridium sp.]|nr:hypothetical protein [Clostridium sp.]